MLARAGKNEMLDKREMLDIWTKKKSKGQYAEKMFNKRMSRMHSSLDHRS